MTPLADVDLRGSGSGGRVRGNTRSGVTGDDLIHVAGANARSRHDAR
jgi:hypothetical protein